MKKLYLIRHGKSSWKDITLDDFDRPLNKRGRKDAPFMAQLLKQKNITPDLIISSPANRAKTTALFFQDILNPKEQIQFDQTLYFSSLSVLEKLIENINNKYETVFILSHNPTLNEFIEKHLDIYDNLPTTGVIGISSDTKSWDDFFDNTLELLMFDYPKNHKERS
ncbi:MAG: histidine phosphatase family protein [Campylobacterota bacterium]|nr:histidine phosphatase family protein [Campylobacterota bacterium]